MDNDGRYALPCRIVLLGAAAVHWTAAALLISNNSDGASTWHLSRAIRRLAVAIAEAMTGA